MGWLLKRTTTETFALDFSLIDENFDWRKYGYNLQDALALGGGSYARDAERFLIEQFEEHEGSLYGDKMFSSRADQDTGLQLIWEED